MFLILPKSHSDPSLDTANAANAGPAEEPRTRVKNACNRCRIKKIKCDGRVPCARCEHDKVVCRLQRGPWNMKETSRSYITSLECQQLTLLNALRQFCQSSPQNEKIKSILQQLKANGFDLGSLEPADRPNADDKTAADPTTTQHPKEDSPIAVDDARLSAFESMLEDGGILDAQSLSGLPSRFGDLLAQQGIANGNYEAIPGAMFVQGAPDASGFGPNVPDLSSLQSLLASNSALENQSISTLPMGLGETTVPEESFFNNAYPVDATLAGTLVEPWTFGPEMLEFKNESSRTQP